MHVEIEFCMCCMWIGFKDFPVNLVLISLFNCSFE